MTVAAVVARKLAIPGFGVGPRSEDAGDTGPGEQRKRDSRGD